ncbi:hypothetical protein IC232_04665 [Microvirga sp. BT688]|uniref:hypothetical protein n=1 Tax=Microvirga sp. TaxID=1873136 RepID=UPI001689EA92|nr:hypothetical protein [Microvirga sp.]MBD2745988.1 hypothetical protein [Microvirga sp.]
MSEFNDLWSQVEALPHPGPAPAPSNLPTSLLPQVRWFRTLLDIRTIAITVMWSGFALLIVLNVMARGSAVGWIIGAITLLAVSYVLIVPTDTSAFRDRAEAAKAEWDRIQEEWENEAGPRTFEVKKLFLLRLRNASRDLPALRDSKVQSLQDDQRRSQLKAFLSQYKIDQSKIANIAAVRSGALQKAGFVTAADIDGAKLSNVPGIGDSVASSLISWRNGLEAEFQFDPSKPITPADIETVDQDIGAQEKELVLGLEQGLADLQRTLRRIQSVRTRGIPILEATHHAHRQAQAQLSHLTS